MSTLLRGKHCLMQNLVQKHENSNADSKWKNKIPDLIHFNHCLIMLYDFNVVSQCAHVCVSRCEC